MIQFLSFLVVCAEMILTGSVLLLILGIGLYLAYYWFFQGAFKLAQRLGWIEIHK